MSITTYTELQTAVASWLNNDNLTGNIPDFIALAENRINRELAKRKVTDILTEADLTISAQSNALPSDFLGVNRVYLDTSPKTVLNVVDADILYNSVGDSSTGKPKMYTIEGSNIIVSPSPDTTYTAKLSYYQKSQLTDLAPTNTVLTNASDIYLYATLAEAEAFLMNDERVAFWVNAFMSAFEDYEALSKSKKFSGQLRTRPQVTV